MTQKITIRCSTCPETEEYETVKCICILWTKDNFGIISHDIDDKDIIFAVRELTHKITAHMERSQN